MQFTRTVTANFKQLIYAAVYSFMPIYAGGPRGYSCSFRAAFPFVQPPPLVFRAHRSLGREGLCQPFATHSRATRTVPTSAARFVSYARRTYEKLFRFFARRSSLESETKRTSLFLSLSRCFNQLALGTSRTITNDPSSYTNNSVAFRLEVVSMTEIIKK